MSKKSAATKRRIKQANQIGLTVTKEEGKRGLTAQFGVTGFYNQNDVACEKIGETINHMFMSGPCKSVSPEGREVKQLEGEELLRFQARIAIRKYKQYIPLLRSFASVLVLTEAQCHYVLGLVKAYKQKSAARISEENKK